MKLLLVNPAEKESLGFSDFARLRMPPLGLAYVAALTPPSWEIAIADENFSPHCPQSADLVAITAFTCNARRAYEIAAIYRRKGVPVVMGGMHATSLPEEAARYVDAVVIGEAESCWPKLIADFSRGRLQQFYKGPKPRLEGVVRPRRHLLDSRYRSGVIQTSRGCPFDCDFCTVTQFFGRTYRTRPVAEVVDELAAIPQEEVIFLDDNLIGSGKAGAARAAELFRALASRGLRKRWFGQVSVNLLDSDDLMRLAAQSGCRGLFFGLESVDADTLRGMRKGINLGRSIEDYRMGFLKLKKMGITTTGAFIVGNDSDTPETFDAIGRFARTVGLDVVQLSLLTPFPGTRLYRRLRDEGRLLLDDYPEDWRHYDFAALVFRTNMPAEEVTRLFDRFMRRNFTYAAMLRRVLSHLAHSKSPRSALSCASVNFAYRRVYRGILHGSWAARYAQAFSSAGHEALPAGAGEGAHGRKAGGAQASQGGMGA